ncbi:hypothetical protein COU54_03895 [Candidatus Pacearchaeota archaeon CG10_big_fil_rev_8_21_14_0_10_31_24]|nr:MAG: hypothetical protein COU54_03895 [Candidatus Pacearchaeota archaeon CG10_big_fil_rev_8_21_14_0_10_31_24]
MDVTILEDLGLTQAEIKVYISLLELGSSSAGRILEKAGIQNSVTHRALNSLIEKGLISYILEGKKKIYQATNPENFHDFIDDKRKRFDKLLPELKKRQGASKSNSLGEIFKGKRGITQMYITLLNSNGKEYNTFGGGDEVAYEIMGDMWWKNLHVRRITKKIPSRQVFDESIRKFGDELNKKKMSKVKFLPKEYAQLQETVIIGDYVGIAIFRDSPYGILIKDKVLADAYRQQFEILWNKAKN